MFIHKILINFFKKMLKQKRKQMTQNIIIVLVYLLIKGYIFFKLILF